MKILFAAAIAAGFALVPAAAAERCMTFVSTPWVSGDPDKQFVIEAVANGPDCANAVLMLVIRDQFGIPHWQRAYGGDVRDQTSGIEGATDFEDGLKRWIAPPEKTLTADQLPEWPAGVEPIDMEVFWPAAQLVREDYEAARAAKAPVYCFLTSTINGDTPVKTCLAWYQTSYFLDLGLFPVK